MNELERVCELNNSVTWMVFDQINGEADQFLTELESLHSEVAKILETNRPVEERNQQALEYRQQQAQAAQEEDIERHEPQQQPKTKKSKKKVETSENANVMQDTNAELSQFDVRKVGDLHSQLAEEITEDAAHSEETNIPVHPCIEEESLEPQAYDGKVEQAVVDASTNTNGFEFPRPEAVQNVIETHFQAIKPGIETFQQLQHAVFEREQQIIEELLLENVKLEERESLQSSADGFYERKDEEEEQAEVVYFDCNEIEESEEQTPSPQQAESYDFASLAKSFAHSSSQHEQRIQNKTDKESLARFKSYYYSGKILSPKEEIQMLIGGQYSRTRTYGVGGRPVETWQ